MELNWAQWGVLVCGVGVAVFSIFATNIQGKQERVQAELIKSQYGQIIKFAEDNYRLTEDVKRTTKSTIEEQNRPDLRIVGGKVSGRLYEIEIKNYGKSTAESVSIEWDYSYATQITTKVRELPPGQSVTFKSEVFPLESIPAMKPAYANTKESFASGKTALIVRLKARHHWNGQQHETPEYTLIWDGKELRLF